MDPALQELIEDTPGTAEIEVILKLKDAARPPLHVRVISQFGRIITARLPASRVAETWADEEVISAKAPRAVQPEPCLPEEDARELDAEAWPGEAAVRADIPCSGKGVVLAVLDWGVDFAHPDFRNEDGSTRLLALWDQGAEPDPRRPNPYGYGVIHTREDINRALASPEPFRALAYHPASSDPAGNGTHGTHTLAIAAGNGRAPGSPRGVAPEADLLFVHLAQRRQPETANLGDWSRLLEALDFVVQIAAGRPWVVNMSLGVHGGPHDGLTLVEQAMDALLDQAPGGAIVTSCGNYWSSCTHTHGRLAPLEELTLGWLIHPGDPTSNELEIWYAGQDRFLVELRSPNGAPLCRAALGERARVLVEGRQVGRLYHRAGDPNNGDNHVDLFLDPEAPAGRWQVTLIGEDVVDGRYHGWIERDSGPAGTQSCFDLECATSRHTTNTICNGLRTVAVGAYDPRDPARAPARFSSAGPTRSGRQKPDLLAPGVRILAARSTPAGGTAGAPPPPVLKSGTSMAAPQVAGTVALMFEAAGRPLSIQETRALLLGTVEPCSRDFEEERMGNGYLDIRTAVAAARSLRREAAIGGASPAFVEARPEEASPDSSGEGSGEGQHGRAPFGLLEVLVPEAVDSPSEKVALRAVPEVLHPAAVFDAVVHDAPPGADFYGRYLEVLALPGEELRSELRAGDLLLWRAPEPGRRGEAVMLVTGRLLEVGALQDARLVPESTQPGWYVHAVGGRTSATQRGRRIARWIADEGGRLGSELLVVRLRVFPEALLQAAPPQTRDVPGGSPEPVAQAEQVDEARPREWPRLLPRADRSQVGNASVKLASMAKAPDVQKREAPPASPLTPDQWELVNQIRLSRQSLESRAASRIKLSRFKGEKGWQYGYQYLGRRRTQQDLEPSALAAIRDELDRKVMKLAWAELSSEGQFGAINAYDSQGLTWGQGFGLANGLLGPVLSKLFRDPEVREAFLAYGIDYTERGLRVVNGWTGAVEEGPSALALVQADPTLLEVFARVGDDPELGPRFVDVQLQMLAEDNQVGILRRLPQGMKAWVEAPQKAHALAVVLHLNHHGPKYGWSMHPRDYEATEGRIGGANGILMVWGRLRAEMPEAQTGALLVSDEYMMSNFATWGGGVVARELWRVCRLPLPCHRDELSRARSEDERAKKQQAFGGKLFILAPHGAGFYVYPDLPLPAGDEALAHARRQGFADEYAYFYCLNGLSMGDMVKALLGLAETRAGLKNAGIPTLSELRETFRQKMSGWFGNARIELAFRVAMAIFDAKGRKTPLPPALRAELLQGAQSLFGASDPQYRQVEARLNAPLA